jgi:hypothetical protein
VELGLTDILPAEWVIGVAQGLLDILTERDTEAKRGADRQGMTLWMEGGRFHQRDIDAAVEEQRAITRRLRDFVEQRAQVIATPIVLELGAEEVGQLRRVLGAAGAGACW